MFVGVGASRVRIYLKSKENAPIFIDEIDAVGRQRCWSSAAVTMKENKLNQLLTEMDGFEGNTGVLSSRQLTALY